MLPSLWHLQVVRPEFRVQGRWFESRPDQHSRSWNNCGKWRCCCYCCCYCYCFSICKWLDLHVAWMTTEKKMAVPRTTDSITNPDFGFLALLPLAERRTGRSLVAVWGAVRSRPVLHSHSYVYDVLRRMWYARSTFLKFVFPICAHLHSRFTGAYSHCIIERLP